MITLNGILDGIIKLKPKDLDLAYGGNITYLSNKTSQWRDKLSKETLGKALDFAKKSQSKDKALYFKNKKNNSRKKAMKLKHGMEEKEKKEKTEPEEKEKLVRTAGQVGLSTKTGDLESNIYL